MSTPCPTCHHLLKTGNRCGSPALRGEQFCFHHHPTRRPPTRTALHSRMPFYVPPITDTENLQIAFCEVIRRLANHTLETKRAGLLLLCLQMAKANLAEMPRRPSEEAFTPEATSGTPDPFGPQIVP